MTKVIFYPLGNADCCLIKLHNGKTFVFDYADMHNQGDKDDKRVPLKEAFKEDIGWPKITEIDVLAITHGDNDHVRGIPDIFWLDHATKYQEGDRIKAKEIWVPAALIVEEGSEDDTKTVRAEARFRFLQKKGIRVFGRPEHLTDWLAKLSKRPEEYMHLVSDAGTLVPSLNLFIDGIEFFVHSPFAERTEIGLLDRNENCLVLQATIRDSGVDTRFLITADSVSENWQKIVNITRSHCNDIRLAWDILKIPHHCSYLSMATEKGKEKTVPTDEFKWLLEQGAERSVMVSSSWPIPSKTEDQPPHVETFRRYREAADNLDADLVVTMENPSQAKPERTVITIDGSGPKLEKRSITAAAIITSSQSPRVG